MRSALAVLAALVLAGCTTPGTTPDTGDEGGSRVVHAPWWPVGAWWDVRLEGPTSDRSFRLVNFLNASDHFWLGVSDRSVALDHALHDTNPLLGRIHWGILTPHESGIHANGMFTFPLAPGKAWSGKLWGRDWALVAESGDEPGAVAVRGTAPDGARISYDYDPRALWFSAIEIRRADGSVETRATVADHGLSATGTYWFLRGRDYYPKDSPDSFTVPREEKTLRSLYVEMDLAYSAPGRLEFIDPSGVVRHQELVANPTGGALRKNVEISAPLEGEWTIRHVGTGKPTGRLDVTGLIEYTANL